MSTQFDTERLVVPVTHKGKTVTYYVRELGYYEFQEVNQDVVIEQPNADTERRGLAVLHRTAVATIEDREGNPAFTLQTWKRLPKGPAKVLTNAVMKAQGMDLEEAREEASEEPEKEDSEGNA